ncbi:MAG TPA: potassium channel family protein [Candidatus Obscuribacterales bacterium]
MNPPPSAQPDQPAPLTQVSETIRELLREPALSDAIAQVIIQHLQATGAIAAAADAPIIHTQVTSRYGRLTALRQVMGAIALVLLILCGRNTLQAIQMNSPSHALGLWLSGISISSGLGLVILLVLEVFLGAGQEQEVERLQGTMRVRDYTFIPAINRLPVVLGLLSIGFSTIILGFSSLYSELVRQDASHFSGLDPGFVAIYFAFVTFSTVGFGDIHAISFIARAAVTSEIAIAMFFSLVVLSTTLSWITAYERQQHEEFIKQRVQGLQVPASVLPDNSGSSRQ